MRSLSLSVAGALLLLAAGCPDSRDPEDDGGGTGVASVTVIGDGSVEGLDVVFHDPAGAVLAHVLTDAAGRASASIPPGALVTVGRHYTMPSERWVLTTVAGVQIGDDLILGRPTAGSSAGTAQVAFTDAAASATEYRVDVGCNSATASSVGSPVSVPFYTTCGATLDALTLARDVGGGLVGWSAAVDLPITGEIPAQTASATSAAWRSDFGALALTLSNPPATSGNATATLTPRRNGVRFSASATSDAGALAPPSSAALSVPFVKDFAASARLEVRVTHAASTDDSRFIDNAAGLTDRTLDLATALPPRVTGAALATDAGIRSATWSLGAVDAALDATTLAATWTDGAGRHDWRVVLRPDATQFTFPALPTAMSAFLPDAAAAPSWFTVVVDDLSTAAGYDAFRASSLGLVDVLPEGGSWTLRRSSTVSF